MTTATLVKSGEARGGYRRGVLDTVAFLPSTGAWGIAFGVAAVRAGLTPSQAIVMSAIVWSGTAQLAILPLLHTSPYLLFLTSLLVSLRFAPMSAAIASMLREPSPWRRALVSCVLVDASFALVAQGHPLRSRAAYLVGAAAAMYLTWVAGTSVGALAGTNFFAGWEGFADQLTVLIFVILTAERCVTGLDASVTLIAGALALPLRNLPAQLGLPAAVLLGSAAGVWLIRKARRLT